MIALFLVVTVCAQPADPAPVDTPAPEPVEVAPEPEPPAPPVEAAPEPPPAPAIEPPPPAPVEPPAPAPVTTEKPAPVEDLRARGMGTGLTAGCLGAGAFAAFLAGLAVVVPATLACRFGWSQLSSTDAVGTSTRWYDPLQGLVFVVPVVLLAACAAWPLGVPVTLAASTVGVMVPQKPTLGRARQAVSAALPGIVWAMASGVVVFAGLTSTLVGLTSFILFWGSFSPSLFPQMTFNARLWHQVNNIACCCLGLSVVSTTLLGLAWPVSLLGAVLGSGWTAWRAGTVRGDTLDP